ncbi:uncharacterized protein LOC111831074 [Capsella rubella]|uniref:uncharacterized protein LOC111831074 n=1 Tax=Capsella rubella TaxID=81985 RepID=UPI000CD4CF22|nr:uncharacterized protein LOC111831074 [Capsella rubella]
MIFGQIRKLVAQATIYNIWKQRNNFVHNQQKIRPTSIFVILDKEIRNIISAKRLRKQFRNLMQFWLI